MGQEKHIFSAWEIEKKGFHSILRLTVILIKKTLAFYSVTKVFRNVIQVALSGQKIVKLVKYILKKKLSH